MPTQQRKQGDSFIVEPWPGVADGLAQDRSFPGLDNHSWVKRSLSPTLVPARYSRRCDSTLTGLSKAPSFTTKCTTATRLRWGRRWKLPYSYSREPDRARNSILNLPKRRSP